MKTEINGVLLVMSRVEDVTFQERNNKLMCRWTFSIIWTLYIQVVFSDFLFFRLGELSEEKVKTIDSLMISGRGSHNTMQWQF